MGYVYLLSTVTPDGMTERFKIGVTKRKIETRIRELQTGNSEPITLLKSYQSENYVKVENLLHKKYLGSKANANNEWFKLEDKYVMSFEKDCEEADDTIKLLLENNPFFN